MVVLFPHDLGRFEIAGLGLVLSSASLPDDLTCCPSTPTVAPVLPRAATVYCPSRGDPLYIAALSPQ